VTWTAQDQFFAAQDQFFAGAPFWYRPSRAPACPRVVVGKRCRVGVDDDQCVCELFRQFLDHGRAWLAPDGAHVVTGEPYGIDDGDAWVRFTTALDRFGIDVEVGTRSPWNPGHTVLVRLTRRL
jgi:hypothetical protein